jgi:hypothetical protein
VQDAYLLGENEPIDGAKFTSCRFQVDFYQARNSFTTR